MERRRRRQEGESLLTVIRSLAEPWVRENAIRGLATVSGGLLSPALLQGLIDVAAIEDPWPRVGALQALVERPPQGAEIDPRYSVCWMSPRQSTMCGRGAI